MEPLAAFDECLPIAKALSAAVAAKLNLISLFIFNLIIAAAAHTASFHRIRSEVSDEVSLW